MKKNTVMLNETEFREFIMKAVKNALKEERDIDSDPYFGGGLPNHYFDNPEDEPIDYEDNEDSLQMSEVIDNVLEETSEGILYWVEMLQHISWLKKQRWNMSPSQLKKYKEICGKIPKQFYNSIN